MTNTLFDTNSNQIDPNKQTIFYVESPCASGKTFSLIRHIIQSGNKAVVATPETVISEAIKTELLSLNPALKILLIESGKYKNCHHTFQRAIKEDEYDVIIVNHSVILSKAIENTSEYDLYIDEIPQIHYPLSISAEGETSEQVRLLKNAFDGDFLARSPAFRELKYTRALAEYTDAIKLSQKRNRDKKSSKGKRDIQTFSTTGDNFNKVYEAIRDTDKLVVARKAELEKFDKIQFDIILKPSILRNFKSATIISADFSKSELFDHWHDEVNFIRHEAISNGLRKVDKAELIKVLYLSEDHGSWTKLQQIGYQTFLDAVAATLANLIGTDTPHIYCHRVAPEFSWKLSSGIRVNSNSRGSNAFQHIDVALYLSPANPYPSNFRFKKDFFQMDGEALKQATTYSAHYQFMCRTSIRDFHADRPLLFIVLDRRAAEALCDRLGVVGEPSFLDIGIAQLRPLQKHKAMTAAERKQKSRLKAKAIKADWKATADYKGWNIRQWSTKEAQETTDNQFMSWEEVATYLSHLSKTYSPVSKRQSMMFSEGTFFKDSYLPSAIETSKLVILDIDTVKRDPQDLADYLQKNKITSLIVNSFTATKENQKIRVLIPLSQAVNGMNYTKIVTLLAADIQSQFGDDFEIDLGACKSIKQRFFVPNNVGYNICIETNSFDNAMHRDHNFLNVGLFLSRNIDGETMEVIHPIEEKSANEKDTEATQEHSISDGLDRIHHLKTKAGSGIGNANHYKASHLLIGDGYSAEEVKTILRFANESGWFGDKRDVDAAVNNANSFRKNNVIYLKTKNNI